MLTTAIFATTNTTITVATTEEVLLEKLGDEAEPRALNAGETTDIAIAPGVFRVISSSALRVTTNSPNVHVVAITINDKQGGPIELGKLVPQNLVNEDVVRFLKRSSF